MDSLDLPHDMLWSGKAEPLSPDAHSIKGTSHSFVSSHPFLGATAVDQLWPIEEDILLSCELKTWPTIMYWSHVSVYDLPGFDIEDDSSTSTTTTIGQQYHDYNKVTKEEQEVEEEHENRTRAEELLLELIELKEEGKY